ncbi:MAG: hypothetical protein ACRD96_08085, partial [Bryobacteraceae bacterium]
MQKFILGAAVSAACLIPAFAGPNTGGSTDPAKSAYQGYCSFSIPANNDVGSCIISTVPAGKRLVIEHASAYCNLAPGSDVALALITGVVNNPPQQGAVHIPMSKPVTITTYAISQGSLRARAYI